MGWTPWSVTIVRFYSWVDVIADPHKVGGMKIGLEGAVSCWLRESLVECGGR